jgi:hypothetical protein
MQAPPRRRRSSRPTTLACSVVAGVCGALLAVTALPACPPRSLVGQPCSTPGETVCEDAALLRCDGRFYALLAECHHECVSGEGTLHTEGLLSADETWACLDGPHVVSGTVTVANGRTLTIEGGSEVRLDPASRVNTDLQGRIVAEGTAGGPILVTSNNGQRAGFGTSSEGGLNVFAVPASVGGEPSVLRHVIIERGIQGLGVFGLETTAAPPVVESCTFRDNQAYGVFVLCNEAAAPIPDFAAAGNLFFANGLGDVSGCD